MAGNLSIGQAISELRKAKGATQEDLATAVSVSAQAVSKWENGGVPDTALIPVIADYFNVPTDKLFGRSASPNICETVHKYVFEKGQFKGFDRAFDIYRSVHDGLTQPFQNKQKVDKTHASHNSDENGYSLMISNGYGNFVKREYWESINLESAEFMRELFSIFAEEDMIEVLFALLRRKVFAPANFKMIKSALVNTQYSDETIQNCLNKLTEKKIINTEISPYEEICETYQIDDMWYLGICSVICSAQALKISLPGISCYLGKGAWPIEL